MQEPSTTQSTVEQTDSSFLADRVTRIEIRIRRIMLGVPVAVALTLCVVFTSGQSSDVPLSSSREVVDRCDKIQTSALELVDGKGRVRASLKTDKLDGEVCLQFKTAEGRDRLVIGISKFNDIPYIRLTDKTGRTRLDITTDTLDCPDIRLTNQDGEVRARLHMWKDDLPELCFEGSSGRTMQLLSAEPGRAELCFNYENGAAAGQFGLKNDGRPQISIQDAKLASFAYLTLDPKGIPSLLLKDNEDHKLLLTPTGQVIGGKNKKATNIFEDPAP